MNSYTRRLAAEAAIAQASAAMTANLLEMNRMTENQRLIQGIAEAGAAERDAREAFAIAVAAAHSSLPDRD